MRIGLRAMKTEFGRLFVMTHTICVGDGRKYLAGMMLLTCCSFLFSGCMVEFTDPLPGSGQFIADRNLRGQWNGVDEQGHAGFIEFASAGSRGFTVSIFGEDSNLGYQNPVFRLTTTKIGRARYLVLKPTDSQGKSDYTLARYLIAGNKLKIWTLNMEKVKAAIKSGRLKGTVTGGPSGGVMVSSESKDVVRFINDIADDPFTFLGEFQKVKR